MTLAERLKGKRILFFLCSLNMGGAERQALLLADYLHNVVGARVEYWGMDKPGLAAEELTRLGIPWRNVPVGWSTRLIRKAWFLVKFWLMIVGKFDILLPYTSTPGILCGMTWRLSGAKVCIWNQRNEGIERLSPWIEQAAIHRVPAFISNSHAGAEFLKSYGVRPEQIDIIYNGVRLHEPEKTAEEWRGELGIAPETRVVTMVANLQPKKDHETLLRAWQIVMQKVKENNQPPAMLVLAGKPFQTAERVHQLAAELDIEDSVIFAGAVKDIPGLLSAVDIAILSSPSEGLPNGVLEAMAAGLPVAGTDIAGIREAVGPRGQEFLSPVGDAQKMADNLLRLLGDPELRAEIGRYNLERIRDEFSPQKMFERTIEVINRYL